MITPLLHITLPEHSDEDLHDEERHFAPIILSLQAVIGVNEWHIRRALRRTQKGLGTPIPPLYTSGVRYREDPPGEENWKDCLAVLKDGHGDCLPLSTLVLRFDHQLVPIALLRVGDRIWGDGAWTSVIEACVTGRKPIFEIDLSNGRVLRCSPEHRVFRVGEGGELYEITARQIKVGDALATIDAIPCASDIRFEDLSRKDLRLRLREEVEIRGGRRVQAVRGISRRTAELCGDVSTDDGKFWVAESDVLVHNCDRLVAWRVAELRVAGVAAEPIIKWQQVPKDVMIGLGHPAHMVPEEGISMVHVCVGWPGWQKDPSRVEDPSKLLGMGGDYTSGI